MLALPLLLLAVPTTASAPASTPAPVSVTATASKAEVTVGEAFAIELKAVGPTGTSYTFPAEASDESFELRSPAEAAGSTEPGLHRYQAAVFALDRAAIPPIPVRYRLADGSRGEATTAPLTIKVVSLLPKDPQQRKLADIRGPLPVSVGRAFWLAAGLVLLVAAAFVSWLVRRRRRAQVPVAARVSETPPDVEALRALDVLAASGLFARGSYREIYIQLTAVAKRYLERRLRAPVLEMTTAETLAFLREHPFGGELLRTVREVAEAADRIKFANGEGLAAEAERHVSAVRALIPALETRLRPAQPAPEGKAA